MKWTLCNAINKSLKLAMIVLTIALLCKVSANDRLSEFPKFILCIDFGFVLLIVDCVLDMYKPKRKRIRKELRSKRAA